MTHSQQMIFGLHPVREAVDAGQEVNKILIRKGMDSSLCKELISLSHQHGIPIQFVPVEKLNRVTRKNHQGIIAFLSPIEYARIENIVPALFEKGIDPFIIMCDGITDTRNIGAISRSAECAGAHAILIPARGSAMISADVVKSSAGAINHMDICRTDNLKASLKFLRNSGLKIVASSEKAGTVYYSADMSGPAVLLLGAEDTGISSELLKMADITVKIPVKGKIASLNVSAAAAILMFEMIRQNNEL